MMNKYFYSENSTNKSILGAARAWPGPLVLNSVLASHCIESTLSPTDWAITEFTLPGITTDKIISLDLWTELGKHSFIPEALLIVD